MTRRPPSHLALVRPGDTVSVDAGHTIDVASSPRSGPYLDDLFLELIELPEDQRAAAIPRLAGGDPDLEAELRALVLADTGDSQVPGELQEGQQLDRYRLFVRLGSGASASVWQAWDTHLHTWTALKVLRPHLTARPGRDPLEFVLHEARAAAQIISDHVVRVREAGRLPDGSCFVDVQLCAEYKPDGAGNESLVVGHPLSLEAGELEPTEAARLIAEAARGVDAAHRQGVLHRDLKPANLLVQPVSRRVLVSDFGLALAGVAPEVCPATPPDASVTIHTDGPAGAIVGTPAWMAPEQARGDVPTRASDIYGLGATLYTLLSGEPPYTPRGHDGQAGRAMDVLLQVRSESPRPLQGPRRLVAIVNKAMARNPADRYATAADLAADLDRWRSDHPTSLDGARPLMRVGLTARRNRETALSLAVLAIALLLFGMSVNSLEQRRVALVASVHDAEDQRARAISAAEAAQRARLDAEAQATLAAQVSAQAEEDAALARSIQAEAQRARDRALEAKAAAQQGQSVAEQLAAEQLALREDADQARALALAETREAKRRADALATRAAQAEAETARVQARLVAVQTERTELADRLDAEVALRIAAETDLELARAAVDAARAECATQATAPVDLPATDSAPAQSPPSDTTAPPESPAPTDTPPTAPELP